MGPLLPVVLIMGAISLFASGCSKKEELPETKANVDDYTLKADSISMAYALDNTNNNMCAVQTDNIDLSALGTQAGANGTFWQNLARNVFNDTFELRDAFRKLTPEGQKVAVKLLADKLAEKSGYVKISDIIEGDKTLSYQCWWNGWLYEDRTLSHYLSPSYDLKVTFGDAKAILAEAAKAGSSLGCVNPSLSVLLPVSLGTATVNRPYQMPDITLVSGRVDAFNLNECVIVAGDNQTNAAVTHHDATAAVAGEMNECPAMAIGDEWTVSPNGTIIFSSAGSKTVKVKCGDTEVEVGELTVNSAPAAAPKPKVKQAPVAPPPPPPPADDGPPATKIKQ